MMQKKLKPNLTKHLEKLLNFEYTYPIKKELTRCYSRSTVEFGCIVGYFLQILFHTINFKARCNMQCDFFPKMIMVAQLISVC